MLNIFDLNKTRDEKEIKKFEIYKNVLKRIHIKIQIHSKKSVSYIVYIIPKVILGLPLYNQIGCTEYCIDKLKKNGFLVIYTYPNMLYISWDHIPSKLKNPKVEKIGKKIIMNPYKDYSEEVYDVSDMSTNRYLNKYTEVTKKPARNYNYSYNSHNNTYNRNQNTNNQNTKLISNYIPNNPNNNNRNNPNRNNQNKFNYTPNNPNRNTPNRNTPNTPNKFNYTRNNPNNLINYNPNNLNYYTQNNQNSLINYNPISNRVSNIDSKLIRKF